MRWQCDFLAWFDPESSRQLCMYVGQYKEPNFVVYLVAFKLSSNKCWLSYSSVVYLLMFGLNNSCEWNSLPYLVNMLDKHTSSISYYVVSIGKRLCSPLEVSYHEPHIQKIEYGPIECSQSPSMMWRNLFLLSFLFGTTTSFVTW